MINGLNLVLADSYALMANSHDAHWNVEGPGFFELHNAFQEHYENLFNAIDEIAERARALDGYPPGGLRRLGHLAKLHEFSHPLSAKDYVAGLIVGHEKTVMDAIALRDAAGAMNDAQSQDLAIERIAWHQKTLWMLKSYLK